MSGDVGNIGQRLPDPSLAPDRAARAATEGPEPVEQGARPTPDLVAQEARGSAPAVVNLLAPTEASPQALRDAIRRNNIPQVQAMLRAGVDVNGLIDYDGPGTGPKNTPLMIAVRQGSVEMVQALVQAGANVNLENGWGMTALDEAAAYSHLECLQVLLHAGANVNHVDPRGFSALMVAKGADCTRELIAFGADLDRRTNSGLTALRYAVEQHDVERLRALLAAGADATIADNDGRTPLQMLKNWQEYRKETGSGHEEHYTEIARLLTEAACTPVVSIDR